MAEHTLYSGPAGTGRLAISARPTAAGTPAATDDELLRIYGLAKRDHCYDGPEDDWPKRAERAATVHGLHAVLARWGRPAAPPAPEIGELVRWLKAHASDCHELGRDDWAAQSVRIATLLQQPSAPAPAVVPVAVSERLPEEGDCDMEGRCWLFSKVESEWRLLNAANPGVPHLKYCFSHWLPAHAIPLPQAGEVEG